MLVSILTRAFARVQRPKAALTAASGCASFNPHSSVRPSATEHPGQGLRPSLGFQSSLELSPECNQTMPNQPGAPAQGFNPHSSFRPSATRPSRHPPQYPRTVSILTRAFARVQPTRWLALRPMSAFQSSLELSPECNANQSIPSRGGVAVQSSLELSPECNAALF